MADFRVGIGGLGDYARNARLKPTLLVVLPISALLGEFGSKISVAVGILWGSLSWVGLTFLLAQLGRDFGKMKEFSLYRMWGGQPSTVMLRHCSGKLNRQTLKRYHEQGQRLLGQRFPTLDEESADPGQADLVYAAFGDLLREKSRERTKYPLLFDELVSYGFRRNLWGLKPFGLAVTSGVLLFHVLIVAGSLRAHETLSPVVVFVGLLCLVVLLVWIFLINPQWVRIVADEYAKRLLETCSGDMTAALKRTGVNSKS
jgi:hypothetical protein